MSFFGFLLKFFVVPGKKGNSFFSNGFVYAWSVHYNIYDKTFATHEKQKWWKLCAINSTIRAETRNMSFFCAETRSVKSWCENFRNLNLNFQVCNFNFTIWFFFDVLRFGFACIAKQHSQTPLNFKEMRFGLPYVSMPIDVFHIFLYFWKVLRLPLYFWLEKGSTSRSRCLYNIAS
jgi:hypothetical protein